MVFAWASYQWACAPYVVPQKELPMHFEIDRSNIKNHRTVTTSIPQPQEGEVVLALQEFALTSNNVSYALGGDFLDYWGFFPTEDGWGRLPVMGFGIVTASANADIAVGTRYFGFFPAADHHVVLASATTGGFIDIGAHREKHAMAYRSFDRVSDTASENDHAYLLLRGLFVTSYLAEDFLFDNGMYGAGQIVVSSASSKTAIAFAHRVRARGNTHCIALTSAANVDFVKKVNLYDEVATYDDIASLADWAPTVYVDMAGNVTVTAQVHEHFGESLMYSCAIGATHWDQGGSKKGLVGPVPQFFFAPSQIAKRGKEWGRDVLNERMDTALETFITDSRRWMKIEESRGADALASVYDQLVSGASNAEAGHIISL
jgi:hypothetical protein